MNKNSLFGKAHSSVTLLVVVVASFAVIGCDSSSSDDKKSTGDIPPAIDYCADGYTTVTDGGTIDGEQTKCLEVEADATVTIKNAVKMAWGTILKINPGATIQGDSTTEAYLIIDQGAKIDAQGTAAKPIVFTSDKAAGSRGSQDWGGVVINGRAKINAGNGTAYGEGDSGLYGGTYDGDSSGIMKYCRIEFAGKLIAATDELNGLALQGVGYNTTLEYLQFHNCADDGIEMFGGKVNLKHIVSTNNGDDQIDCTFGWRGKIQFAIAAPFNGDAGIEHDNNEDNFAATPQTNVAYYNFTYVRNPASGKGARCRRGTIALFRNSYFVGAADDSCVIAEDSPSQVDLDYSIIEACGTNGYQEKNSGALTLGSNVTTNATAAYLTMTNFANITALSTAGANAFVPGTVDNTGVTPPNDGFYDTSATFIGAVGATNWLSGWTSFPVN